MSIFTAWILFLIPTLLLSAWFVYLNKRTGDDEFENAAFIGFIGLAVGLPLAIAVASSLGNLILIYMK